MRSLVQTTVLMGLSMARQSPGTIIDESPLVVLYYDNWAGWIRDYSPSHVEKNFLSREMPVRNFVLNYAFFTWNPVECSLIPTDQIDLQKGDKGGWTTDDWNIEEREPWETSKPMGGHLPAFMMLKSRYPHVKLLPSIGGWSRSHTFHDCIINKEDHMIKSMVDHVTVWGWDGVDFDWEYPNCDGAPCGCQGEATCTVESGFSNVAGPGDWDRYKQFVHKTRLAFNELEDKVGRRLYITAALGMNPKLIDGHNDVWSTPMPIEWMCEEDDFDWVNLMTYDFYGPWTALTGPLAPLYSNPNLRGDQMSIDDSMQRILKRCSAPHKLTMGLATYGKTWQSVPKEGDVPGLWQSSTARDVRGGGTWELGTVSYFDIKKNMLPRCTRTWDDHSKTPTLYCATFPTAVDIPSEAGKQVQRGQPNTFVSYEDGESWKEKMAYARSKGMAGAIIWAASDTGNGKAYAPDSTADLFNGLLEGWFGEKRNVPETSTLKSSPGTMKRWAEYPCPNVTGYSKGMQVIDVSRCQGVNYDPTKKYLTVPKSFTESDLGKDKILIHPLGDSEQTTSPPASSPIKPSSAPTMPTSAPTKPSLISTTAAAEPSSKPSECNCSCPAHPTVRPEPTTYPNPSPTQPTTLPSTTPAQPSNSILEGCITAMKTVPQWGDYCGQSCATFFAGPWCSSSKTADELARCVRSMMPYCTQA